MLQKKMGSTRNGALGKWHQEVFAETALLEKR